MVLKITILLLNSFVTLHLHAATVDDKIHNIWGLPNRESTTLGSCTCDDYRSCLNKYGEGLINIRIDECRSYKKCCDDDKTIPDDLKPLGDTDQQTSETCTCVEQYLCNKGTVNKDGDGIIDIRVRECESYLEKCCEPNDITSTAAPPPVLPPGCGFRNSKGVGFKIKDPSNGEAEFGEFPWMVAVFTRLNLDTANLPIYQCGGALIHSSVVLSAAHCVKNKDNLKVRAGEWDTQTKKEQYPFQDRDVDSMVVHPEFKPGTLFNDVALLFLKTPVELAPHIGLVCLPPPGAVFNKGRCFSSGWGKNNFAKEDQYQVILKKVDLPIVPRDRCQQQLRKTRLGRFFELHKSFVCAGGEPGKDTCTGDGGSPLVCPIEGEEDRYHQVGIVAWGIGCGDAMVPGIYANVALLRSWIDKEMENRNLETKVYQL